MTGISVGGAQTQAPKVQQPQSPPAQSGGAAQPRTQPIDKTGPSDQFGKNTTGPDAKLKGFEDRSAPVTAPSDIRPSGANGSPSKDKNFVDNGNEIEVKRNGASPAPLAHGGPHAPQVAGAPGNQAAPPQTDAERLTGLRNSLNATEAGKTALGALDGSGANVRFADGGGSYYDPGKNEITIDRTLDSTQQAITLAHEAEHARTNRAGEAARFEDHQTRQSYADARMHEETRATVSQIKVANELKTPTTLSPQYNDAYKNAYDAEYQRLRTENPDGDDEAAKQAARTVAEQAGYDRVFKGFQDGEVVTSTTQQGYGDYYGDAWDAWKAAQPKP